MPIVTPALLVIAFIVAGFSLEGAAAQECTPWVPVPGGQSLDIWLTKPSNNNCAVTNGTYILKGSILKLDAFGAAYGECQRWYPLPAPCHIIGTYQRNMADIDAWDDDYPQYYSTAYGKDANGVCKVGVTHEIDTRNYSPTSCGRFALYTAEDDEDLTISVEGDIQSTPCSITPVNTEIETISFHSRCALSRGSPCSGTLLEGGPMNPLNGVGYEHYHGTDPPSTEPNDTWGSCNWIHEMLIVVGDVYENIFTGEEFGYGDISKPGGGPWDHDCHQNGREVDVWYESINGDFLQINFDQTTGSGAGSGPDSNYDRFKTIWLINSFIAYTGYMSGSAIDFVIVDARANITSADLIGNPQVIVDTTNEHRHHFHLRMKDEDGPDGECY